MRPHPLRRRVLPLLLGLALAAALTVAVKGDPRADAEAPPPALPVEVLEVRATDGYPVRELHAGRVVARRASDLGFERAGRLVEVAFDHGARVETGAVLARLDTRELEARRRQLVAERDRIAAELALARATTARRVRLHEAGHLSNQRLDETAYTEQSLEAQEAAARAALEHVDVQLALSELVAPFGGILAQRFADEGTVVQPGVAVVQLIEDRALEVHVGVPLQAAATLAVGSRHPVDVEGHALDATVTSVLPTVDPETRTLTVVFRVDEPAAAVRPGALARVALEVRIDADGFWLPLSALAEGRRGLWTAYVARPEPGGGHVLERRQVEVIHAEASRAYVAGTLRSGDQVVASGVHRLVPGARVRLVPGAS